MSRKKRKKKVGANSLQRIRSRKEKKLESIYYNYGQEGALLNDVKKLSKIAGPTISEEDVRTFLTAQPSYTVHRRLKRKQFPRRTIFVPTAGVRADADLIEMGDLAEWNDQYRYIIAVIDSFSKFLWATPLKNKTADSTAAALKNFIENQNFRTLQLYSDGGREFTGSPFQSILKKYKIKHRICTSEEFHCPFIERANRSLKEKIFQALTAGYSRRWIDILPKIVDTYNKTKHSTSGASPEDLMKNLPELYLAVLKKLKPPGKSDRKTAPPKYRFKTGDLVRILKRRDGALQSKGYLPRFGWEIFKVKKRANDRSEDMHSVPAYVLEDLKGEEIENALFYEDELSLVNPTQLNLPMPIEQVLERKGDRLKVWFKGFPKDEAVWISRKQIV